MDTHRHSLVERVMGDRRTHLVALVDVLLLTTLVLVGVSSHGTNPLAEPLTALERVTPFVIAWVPIAVLAGVYVEDALSAPVHAARVVTVGWLAAANVGFILRSSPLFTGGASWPFTLVLTGLGLIVLLSWRVIYASLSNRL